MFLFVLNEILGQIIVAHIRLSIPESLSEFRKRMRAFLQPRLSRAKIPTKVVLTDQPLHSDRFKKISIVDLKLCDFTVRQKVSDVKSVADLEPT